MTLVFVMSEKRALELGLIFCRNCPHPPNNHFDFGKKPCAHCKCIAFEMGSRDGVKLSVHKPKKRKTKR